VPRILLKDVESYPGALAQLACVVGNLWFDALAAFLHALAAKVDEDGNADAGQGRRKLAAALHAANASVTASAVDVELVWSICTPRM
jgi:hypothetical protein